MFFPYSMFGSEHIVRCWGNSAFPMPVLLGVIGHASGHLSKLGGASRSRDFPQPCDRNGENSEMGKQSCYAPLWHTERTQSKCSIFHHLQTFEAFETGYTLFSAYSCLAKWDTVVSATVTHYYGTVLKTRHVFFPQDLCLTDSHTIRGITHIFSLSLLSQHGQPVIQPWPHLQLGLGVFAVAPSAQAALPHYRHFSNEPIWLGCSCPDAFHPQMLLHTSPSTTIHGWRQGCTHLKLISIQWSSLWHGPTNSCISMRRGTSLQRCGDGDPRTITGWGHFYLEQVMMVQHSVTRVLILINDAFCAPVSANYKRKRQKEIFNVHLVSRCKYVRKRQRLTKDLLHTINYFFLNDYK